MLVDAPVNYVHINRRTPKQGIQLKEVKQRNKQTYQKKLIIIL